MLDHRVLLLAALLLIVTGANADASGTAEVANAPVVVSTEPADKATGVALGAKITVTFSESMDRSSVEQAFNITPSAGPGTFTWNANDSGIAFSPRLDVAPSTDYFVTIGAQARSLAGEAMAAPFSFRFLTISSPPAPTLDWVFPIENPILLIGSKYTLDWYTAGTGPVFVTLNLSRQGESGPWETILKDFESGVGRGAWEWNVTGPSTSTAVVRFEAKNAVGSAKAYSTAFEIVEPPGPWELSISEPRDGQTFQIPSSGDPYAPAFVDLNFTLRAPFARETYLFEMQLSADGMTYKSRAGDVGGWVTPGTYRWGFGYYSIDDPGTTQVTCEARVRIRLTEANVSRSLESTSERFQILKGQDCVQVSFSAENPEGKPLADALIQVVDRTNGRLVAANRTSAVGTSNLWLANDREFEIRITHPDAGEAAVSGFRPASGHSVRMTVRPVQTSAGWTPALVGVGAGVGLGVILALLFGGEVAFLAFALPFAAMYSRFKREDVLDHFLRGEIYGAIRMKPGVTYSEMKEQLKLANGTLTYHLHVLERSGMVRSLRSGRNRMYYPEEIRPEGRALLSAVQKAILELVKSEPGISQTEISAKLDRPTQTVNYNVHRLVKSGKLRLEGWRFRKRCFPAEGTATPGSAAGQ